MSIGLAIVVAAIFLNLSFIQLLLYLLTKSPIESSKNNKTNKSSTFEHFEETKSNSNQIYHKKVPLPDPSVFLSKTPTVVSGFGNKAKSVEDNK